MSIASRIEAIEGHIGDIYDTLELGGSDLTNVDKNIVNINSELIDRYKDYLANGTDLIWNNWDNTTAEGTELTLNNTIQAKMKIKPQGNTEQATRSGKNLLEPYFQTQTANGITITFTDDGMVVSGNSTSQYQYFKIFEKQLPAGTYTVNGIQGSSFSTYILSVLKNGSNINYTAESKFTFTLEESATITFYFYPYLTNYTIPKTFQYQLEVGSTPTSYEPYGASPSPEYPSEIKNVKGSNFYNQNNILLPTGSYEIIDDAISISNGVRDFYKINWKENTAYTITYDIKQYSGTGNGRLEILYTDGTKEDCGANNSLTDYSTKSKTSNANKTIDKIRATYGSGGRFILKNIMINEGGVIPYLPYNTVEVKVQNGNLLPFINQDFTLSGVRFYVQDGILYLNGTSQGETNPTNNAYKTNFSFTLPAGTYYFDRGTQESQNIPMYLKKYSDNSNLAVNLGSFTLTEETQVYLGIYLYQMTFNSKKNYIQLNIGTTATDYIEHQEQNYPISLGDIELCKIGKYQDYIYKENGNWYKHAEIGKVVLDGTETFVDYPSQVTDYYKGYTSTKKLSSLVSSTNTVSNYFKCYSVGYVVTINIGIMGSQYAIYVNVPNSIATNSSELKNWLSTHNVIIEYPLDEPTNTQITDTTLINQLNVLEQAYSYNEQTNISQDGDLPFILDITALTELS